MSSMVMHFKENFIAILAENRDFEAFSLQEMKTQQSHSIHKSFAHILVSLYKINPSCLLYFFCIKISPK